MAVAVTVSPAGKEVSPQAQIVVRFQAKMATGAADSIRVTSNGWEDGPNPGEPIQGSWSTEDGETFTFAPARRLEPGSLTVIQLASSIRSRDGEELDHECLLNCFLVDDGVHYGSREILLPCIKTANQGTHRIPMRLTVPDGGGSFPVMFWVHGGGWRGGTPEKSEVPPGNQAAYLADHLGIAVASVAYRCKGSAGSFTQALEDVMDAIQYIREHAEAYGISTRRIGLYGGSAGTPLSALAAQRTPEADLYIGYNGIYDFVALGKAAAAKHDDYGLTDPSAEANSAIYHLKPNPPSTLLLHGTDDRTVSPQQSVKYVQAIREAGGRAELLMYKGEAHAFFNAGRPMELPTLYGVKEFIKRVWEIQP